MASLNHIQKGVLICSLSILLGFAAYLLIHILPNIERLSSAEQEEEWFTTLFHMPSIFPALFGLLIFKRVFPDRKILYLYLTSLGLFICCYGWSLFAPGAIAAGIPVILLLWPVNLFLSIYVLERLLKRPKQPLF